MLLFFNYYVRRLLRRDFCEKNYKNDLFNFTCYDDHSVTVSEDLGVYFEYNLPNNKILMPIIYGDISFLIVSACRVRDYDDATSEISIGIRYIHLKKVLSFSASYSMTSVGVSVNEKYKPVYYDSSYSWDYVTDYYA